MKREQVWQTAASTSCGLEAYHQDGGKEGLEANRRGGG